MTTIGPTVSILGEITSHEDLAIEGHVDGLVTLRSGTLSIGPRARVEGTIRCPRVIVAGTVKAGIAASERIELRATATVEGNLSSIQIVMAEGAHFNGGVDMAQRTIAAKVAQFKGR
jgi:cytoskeletal protein CcmA (bactofilin family)